MNSTAQLQEFLSTVAGAAAGRAPFQEFLTKAASASEAQLQEFLSTLAEAAAERAPFQEFLTNAASASEALHAAMLSVRPTLLAGLAAAAIFCRLVGTHRALRWPIFWLISSLMALDLVLYLLVRLVLCGMEWVVGMRRRGHVLRRSASYEEWRGHAATLDRAEGRELWRQEPKAQEYDWRHCLTLTKQMAAARSAGDAEGLMSVLHHALKPNVGGIHEEALYRKARCGTKLILEEFIAELGESVGALAALSANAPAAAPPVFTVDGDQTAARAAAAAAAGTTAAAGAAAAEAAAAARARVFLDAHLASWGRAALVLTGGAICGVYHLGVVRALLELRMLPRVVHGTSAGAVVAALLCTRTEAELVPLLTNEAELWREMGADGPFHGSLLWKLTQLLRHGRVYDWLDFSSHMAFFSRGMTFAEAYAHSGRVLNISCTPLRTRGSRAPPLMLNHEFTPDVDIASAVCASSCVPGLIDPVYICL